MNTDNSNAIAGLPLIAYIFRGGIFSPEAKEDKVQHDIKEIKNNISHLSAKVDTMVDALNKLTQSMQSLKSGE